MSTQRPARTYAVRTLGCQMNAHDSERIAGLLEAAGYRPAPPGPHTGPDGEATSLPQADVVVLNTCAVRENAATRLYGNLGQLAQAKQTNPNMQIAVGGCLAQLDRHKIIERAPWVDVVFGTHTMAALPALLTRAAHNQQAQIEIAEALTVFPSTLPTKRESVYAAWVSISVGCDNTCTFCIVPTLRGKERDRHPDEIIAEIQALVSEGAIEITLLGQNVNTYGRDLASKTGFADLLRRAGAVPGIQRVRFTSPHPAAFTDDVIAAMAEVPTVMPQLHMPLQSGSDRILRAMRRSYRRDRFMGILDRVRQAIPDAAISTDVIVGFPGESESDFAETLDVVRQARFASAFTFQYSPRPGTPAADLPDQVPPEVMTQRYSRLVELQESISEQENQAQIGKVVEVIVSDAPGRKDAATKRLSGRAEDGRLVHIAIPPADAVPQLPIPRPGDMVKVEVTASAPHHLIADSALTGGVFEVTPTAAGEAWARYRFR
ncbi:MAG: tRNA (N6-isopentenyl adenosine(37)-C2)-methylthiotransferase MiaB [Bifidobacteriaceae bacterium]|jgi:tRNA-2-methylthio-N6-dimethylallyladenosine synthase|nr:tRNA (N6-isopentenyl adenosine(37)-C2)-methylthiotransferase MiaB [Bifidobacteriaceae bacterium]